MRANREIVLLLCFVASCAAQNCNKIRSCSECMKRDECLGWKTESDFTCFPETEIRDPSNENVQLIFGENECPKNILQSSTSRIIPNSAAMTTESAHVDKDEMPNLSSTTAQTTTTTTRPTAQTTTRPTAQTTTPSTAQTTTRPTAQTTTTTTRPTAQTTTTPTPSTAQTTKRHPTFQTTGTNLSRPANATTTKRGSLAGVSSISTRTIDRQLILVAAFGLPLVLISLAVGISMYTCWKSRVPNSNFCRSETANPPTAPESGCITVDQVELRNVMTHDQPEFSTAFGTLV